MKNMNRLGLAAGLAAALALFGNAQAQSATGSGSGQTGSGSRGDTGGPTPGGADRGTGTTRGSTDPQGGAPGTSSDSGTRGGSTGSSATGSPGATSDTTSPGAGSSASGRQAASGQAGGKVDKDLQERLEKLHAMNQAEVQAAQVAAQSAQSPEVKQFAEHMQTDHQRADQKLTSTAQSLGVNLEGETFQKEQEKAKKDMDKIQSKTGKDFDKAFMSQMVKDHEKAIKEVDSARKDAKKGNHTELATLLDSTHTGMQGHLQHAKQVQKAVDKGGGERQGRRATGATGGTGSGNERGTGSDRPASGSRGDTGGPTPGGADRGSGTSRGATDPQGGAPGSSSDSGQRTTK